MPPKKRKGRSAASASTSTSTSTSTSASTSIISRRNRRSPVTASASSNSKIKSKFKKAKNKLKDAAVAAAAEAARQSTLDQSASYKMHTITHHASFVPTTNLQHTKLSDSGSSYVYTDAYLGVNGNTGNGNTANAIGSVNGNHKTIATSGVKRSRPYALYHPRNLGLVPPTIIQPPSDATVTSHGHGHHHHHHTTTNKGKGSKGNHSSANYNPLAHGNHHHTTTNKGKGSKGNHSSANYNPLAHGNFNTSHVDMNTPHSAGCRMKYLTQPTFHPLPPSTTNPLEMHHTMSTVMAKGNSNNGTTGTTSTIAIGDSGGFVTIYTSIPSIRSLVRLKTSASERFYNTYAHANTAAVAAAATKSKAKRRKSDNEALSSSSANNANANAGTGASTSTSAGTSTSTSAGSAAMSHHLPLHFHSKSIVASSIDKSNAVECLALLRDGVCIGTHMEIEFIEFDHANDHANGHDHDNSSKRRWIWHGDYGWDDCDGSTNNHESLEKGKRMIRGHPLRLDANDYYENINGTNRNTNSTSKSTSTGTKILASFGCVPCPRSKHDDDEMQNQIEIRPEIYSPILMIDAESGALSNVVPRERSQNKKERERGNEINMDTEINVELDDKKNDVQNDNDTDTMWVNCKLGPRATAIFDKRMRGNIVASFITYRYDGGGNGNGDSDGNDNGGTGELIAKQELMMMNSSHQIIHRTTLPTKSNGHKLITVEAINQSSHGDYTISATSKGGVRVYTTDG
eukprot:CAMPEP_0194125730 /NCGR_PEP_ID=MMETSP0150-20130528/59618_1 /TAXON_ID=122233 /ORGANISM="Chaetoceros debilis, Strain MM31A-1" /LENGTH=740 /DNA_ID=CAMNT_0038819553 /DNA_START=213 /DNA_END=2431 /DNA_ORIENTATION=-